MNIENLSMEFGLQKIFDNVNIHINENDKVGIIGVNGAGKSTLFKIILKELIPTSGKITFKSNTSIGFLPQVLSDEVDSMELNVFDYLLSGRPIKELNEKLTNLYQEISEEDNQIKIDKLLKQIGKTQELLDYYQVYECESILLKIIAGMNISSKLLDMNLNELSGGQKSKIAFGKLLYSNPEIMLLDEPTNHLDNDTKDYIVSYLKEYKGTVLVISHDIGFLDEVTNSTLFLSKTTHKMELYNGSYKKYLKIKEERENAQIRLLEKQEKEEEKLKKIITKYLRGNEKKANIAKDRQKKLAKLENSKVVVERKLKTTRFKIEMDHPSGAIPLKVNDVSFGYNKELLIKNLSFELSSGEKFLIVGENGIGKSTLLKLIMDILVPLNGTIEKDTKVDIAYYAQEHELLDTDKSIIDNFQNKGISIDRLRSLLGNFLFTNDDIYKKINILSPGERCRVMLLNIAISHANFLILDEPTNHLDPETQKIIADAFNTYNGTILLVSHNIEFIERVGVTRMLLLPSGIIKYYDKDIVSYYHDINQSKEK